ncbi:YrdB family protein [Streptomyces sp. NPDC001770]
MRLPALVRAVNELLAFYVEVVAIGEFARWGWNTSENTVPRVVLAVGLPVVAAVVWGMFASPKARFTLPVAGVVGVKVLVGLRVRGGRAVRPRRRLVGPVVRRSGGSQHRAADHGPARPRPYAAGCLSARARTQAA